MNPSDEIGEECEIVSLTSDHETKATQETTDGFETLLTPDQLKQLFEAHVLDWSEAMKCLIPLMNAEMRKNPQGPEWSLVVRGQPWTSYPKPLFPGAMVGGWKHFLMTANYVGSLNQQEDGFYFRWINSEQNIGQEKVSGSSPPRTDADKNQLPLTGQEALDLREGSKVNAKDSVGVWYAATVLKTDLFRVFIHFDAWGNKWDEWLNRNSDRLAVYNPNLLRPRP